MIMAEKKSELDTIAESLFDSLYTNDKNNLEIGIIKAYLSFPDQFRSSEDSICEKKDSWYHKDFSSRIRNMLFLSLRDCKKLNASVGADLPITREFVWAVAQSLWATYPELGNEGDIDDFNLEWDRVEQFPKDGSRLFGFPTLIKKWLQVVRAKKIVANASLMGDVENNPATFAEKLFKGVQDVDKISKTAAKTMFSFGEVAMNVNNPADILSSGFPQMDRKLGGGFFKGSSYLFVAFSGVGKSTVTTQWSSTFCVLQDAKGMVITTEERPDKIKLRYVAHCCEINWETIRNNKSFDPSTLEPKKKELFKRMSEKLDDNLYLVDWTDPTEIDMDIEALVENFKKEKGCVPDFIIMDWIGGALEGLASQRNQEIRHVYNEAANTLTKCALRHDMVVIFMAQANADGVNNMRVGINQIAESKAMAKGVAAVIGMSALQDKNIDASGSSESTYQENQYLFLSKTRFGTGGTVPFRRKFEYQKLIPGHK